MPKRTLILVIVQTQVEGLSPRQVEIRGEAEYFSIKLADVHFQNALRSEIISHRHTSQGVGRAAAPAPQKIGNCQFFGEFISKFRGFGC